MPPRTSDLRAQRDGSIGTELLTVLKEQLGEAHAYVGLHIANMRLEDLRRFMRTNNFASCPGAAGRGAGMSFVPQAQPCVRNIDRYGQCNL